MRLITFFKGIGLGAGLMYLFDPDMGRRRRALIRDQAVHAEHVAMDTVGSKARHLRNQAQGMAAETRSMLMDRASTRASALSQWTTTLPGMDNSANQRLLESIVGGLFAYYGTRRRGLLGAAASMLGMSLLAHSVADQRGKRTMPADDNDTKRRHPSAEAMRLQRVADIMTRDVETVEPDTLLKMAAEKMKERNVGSLPVVEGDRLIGVLSDRDITIRSTAEAYDPLQLTVRDIMTPEPVTILADQSVEEAARLMEQHQIRRLPVIIRDGRLVGIVALGDLAVDAPDSDRAGAVLERVSEPAMPNP